MHLINIYNSIDRIEIRVYPAAIFLDFQTERIYDIGNYKIRVYILHAERTLFLIEHRHLKHFLHLEAQTLSLVVDYIRNMLKRLGRLTDRLVVEHLSGERNGGDGSLEFMRHVVDEIIFHLRDFLLPEGHNDCIEEYYQDHKGEDKRWNHKLHRTENVFRL